MSEVKPMHRLTYAAYQMNLTEDEAIERLELGTRYHNMQVPHPSDIQRAAMRANDILRLLMPGVPQGG